MGVRSHGSSLANKCMTHLICVTNCVRRHEITSAAWYAMINPANKTKMPMAAEIDVRTFLIFLVFNIPVMKLGNVDDSKSKEGSCSTILPFISDRFCA